ncbi:MAG: PqqD family protein [Pseudomonadota bacterium]
MLKAVQFNDQEFAFEKFEHEIVVLHLVEGTYYAFGGSAVAIWDQLIASRPLTSLSSLFKEGDDNGREPASVAIADFVDKLVQERILLAAEPSAEQQTFTDGDAAAIRFEPPRFEKHADMQDLLTLDPIHDVDPEKGWPHT